MIYTIKPIPTSYAGVDFRSRLEARWAAFFDLAGLTWDYEPIDLPGWTPDFLLRARTGSLLVEVKPIDLSDGDVSEFDKAFNYWRNYQVLLLGLGPLVRTGVIGAILDTPDASANDWLEVHDALSVINPVEKWRQAGNIVQWKPDDVTRREVFKLTWTPEQEKICKSIKASRTSTSSSVEAA